MKPGSNQERTGPMKNDGVNCPYLLVENAGRVALNAARPENRFAFPERYLHWHQRLLQRFLKENRDGSEYPEEMVINAIGLIRLGFFLRLFVGDRKNQADSLGINPHSCSHAFRRKTRGLLT
jgi:hypothetical protein